MKVAPLFRMVNLHSVDIHSDIAACTEAEFPTLRKRMIKTDFFRMAVKFSGIADL